jgi:hypothetical protein
MPWSLAIRTLTFAIVVLAAASPRALADFKVKQPDAEFGEFEVETVGSYGRSGNPDTNNEQSDEPLKWRLAERHAR